MPVKHTGLSFPVYYQEQQIASRVVALHNVGYLKFAQVTPSSTLKIAVLAGVLADAIAVLQSTAEKQLRTNHIIFSLVIFITKSALHGLHPRLHAKGYSAT